MNALIKIVASLTLGLTLINSNAASLSFDMTTYSAPAGSQVSVSIIYDFTDTIAFGGGFNVLYDASVLEFVSYTELPFMGFGYHDPVFSPNGALDSPGNYLGAGIGVGKTAFSALNTRAAVGTFVFNVTGQGGDGGCGATLCLTPVLTHPMISLAGNDITDSVFANGVTEARVVPIPAALWLMLSGIVMLAGTGHKKNAY